MEKSRIIRHKKASKFLKEETRKVLYKRITSGISVRRGVRSFGSKVYAHDPGDFGRGVYYDTNYYRAKSYGYVIKSIISLSNPIILSSSEAYDLADKFQTVRLSDEWYANNIGKNVDEARLINAQKMTEYILSLGYDGLAAVNVRFGGIEIVDYRPYKQG